MRRFVTARTCTPAATPDQPGCAPQIDAPPASVAQSSAGGGKPLSLGDLRPGEIVLALIVPRPGDADTIGWAFDARKRVEVT